MIDARRMTWDFVIVQSFNLFNLSGSVDHMHMVWPIDSI